MSSLKLLYNAISPPCRFLLMLVDLLKIKIKLQEVDILTKTYVKQLSEINPQHTVPTLLDGNLILWESHAIAPYLISKYSHNESLYPKDFPLRAVIDQRLHFDSGVLYPLLNRTIKPILFRNQFGIYSDLIIDINKSYWFLDNFANGKNWLCCDSMTIADISCISTLSTLDMLYPIHSKWYPNLYKFIRNFEEMPFYTKCNLPGLNILAKEIQGRMQFYNNIVRMKEV